MKRKLKDFLNKRVISTAISAAITFNMIAILPMSVLQMIIQRMKAIAKLHPLTEIDISSLMNP